MPEIIHDRHAASDAAHFHAAFDPFKRVESGLKLFVRQAAMFRASHHRQRIAHVQFADEIEVKLEARYLELARRRRQFQIERAHGVVITEAEPLYWTMRDVEQRR